MHLVLWGFLHKTQYIYDSYTKSLNSHCNFSLTDREQEVWLLHPHPPQACCLWLSPANSANQPPASWNHYHVQTQ